MISCAWGNASEANLLTTPQAMLNGSREENKMKQQAIVILVTIIAVTHVAKAIDYKKNTISGSRGTSSTTFHSFSSSITKGGSNTTTVVSGSPSGSFQFGNLDWGDRFGRRTLDQRIRDAEQKLFKLYFIRDVCRTLEDEITISFEKKDLREVMKQVSTIKKTELPFEVPEGTFIVEKSNVSGMPSDQFLNSIAQVCGLELRYERDKLVFVKQENTKSSRKNMQRTQ